MGLAASQARLLTITSRKSRAQFENMRLSHQKLALSRSLTDISNEYQNSLNQTKLFYDFYGVNSTDTPLTYDLLMSPSSINDYTPTLMTNNQNQVILSTPYADAARAAGIPMEGLGCQPSSVMRDAFMQALAQNGIITQNTADMICSVDYNQGAGLGNSNLVSTVTTTGDYEALMAMLNDDSDGARLSDLRDSAGNPYSIKSAIIRSDNRNVVYNSGIQGGFPKESGGTSLESLDSISLADLLSGNVHYYLGVSGDNNAEAFGKLKSDVTAVTNLLGDKLEATVDGASEARAYADMMMDKECWNGFSDNGVFGPKHTFEEGEETAILTYVGDAAITAAGVGGAVAAALLLSGPWGWAAAGVAAIGLVIFNIFCGDVEAEEVGEASLNLTDEFLLISEAYGDSAWPHKDPADQQTLDLSAYLQAWFTYFMQYMYGLGTAEANDLDVYWGGAKKAQKFVNKENCEYQFTFTKEFVSENDALISNFYDTLFNQICINGWAPNSQIDKDSNYLKEMLQSGMMYVTSMSDDYYFYQNNYATNSFIKEVADDAAIAEAESKYTTQKARINAKEQELDLKMKNLDTEISSLETEYEAVKKVIENNASKSFTRYDG